MRKFFSIVLILLIVVSLFSAILVTVLNGVITEERYYAKIFKEEVIQSDIADLFTTTFIEQIIKTNSELKNILYTQKAADTIKKFILESELPQNFGESAIGVVKYINGKEPSLNLFITYKINENDFSNLRTELIRTATESIDELKKCESDVNVKETDNCRPRGLTFNDILNRVKKTVYDSVLFSKVKEVLSGQIPLNQETVNNINKVREYSILLNKIILGIWGLVAVLMILLVILNIKHINFLPHYVNSFTAAVAILVGGLGLFLQVITLRNVNLSSLILKTVPNYTSDQNASIIRLLDDIVNVLIKAIFYDLYFYAALLLAISLMAFCINHIVILLNKKADG